LASDQYLDSMANIAIRNAKTVVYFSELAEVAYNWVSLCCRWEKWRVDPVWESLWVFVEEKRYWSASKGEDLM